MPADSPSTTSPSQPSAASAMAINLPTFPEFDLQPRDTVPVRFEKYVKRLDNMFTAMNITRASQKKAMLLHYVGEETCDVFETLTVPEPPEGSDEYKTAVKALADHFEPQKCVDYHVYAFRQETQKSGENITEFYTRLQLLARKCQFADPELEIKRQIIQGTSSLRLRRKAIEQSLNLENLLKVARAMETADEQTTEMEKQQSNAVGYGRNKATDVQQKENSRGLPKSGLRNNRCGLCGGNYPHQGTCPAQGKKCLNCGKMNHFSKVCRGKPKNRSKSSHLKKPSKGKHHARSAGVEESPSSEMLSLAGVNSDSSEEYTFNIGAQRQQAAKPIFQVTIMNTPIRIMADSGATVNILRKRDFDGLKSKPQLVETSAKVYPYMSDKPLTLCGKFRATVTSGSCSSVETFSVAKGSSSSILSWTTSQALILLKLLALSNLLLTSHLMPQIFYQDYPWIL